MMDEYKIQALWEQIRESEYLTKEQIQKLNNLIDELKDLNSSNSSTIETLTKLYNITDTLSKNLDAINLNLKENVTNLNEIVENANEKIQKTIKNSVKLIDTNPIKQEIKNQIKDIKKDIANAMSREKDDLDKLNDKLKDDVEILTENLNDSYYQLENVIKKIKDTTDQLTQSRLNLNDEIKKVNFKLTFFVSIIVGIIIAIITLSLSQYFYFKFEKPTLEKNLKKRVVPDKFICYHNNKRAFCFNQKIDNFDVDNKSGWVYVYLTPPNKKNK